jgi:hypothetical protein
VPLRAISKNLVHAVLSAEDPNFFGHEGIDWDAVKESIETNIEKGRYARGGSTITQQLAKNLFYTTRKSLIRKAREGIVATWMERDLTKQRIIEIYLNVIEWGDGVYGCEAAARRYYRTSCAALERGPGGGTCSHDPLATTDQSANQPGPPQPRHPESAAADALGRLPETRHPRHGKRSRESHR